MDEKEFKVQSREERSIDTAARIRTLIRDYDRSKKEQVFQRDFQAGTCDSNVPVTSAEIRRRISCQIQLLKLQGGIQ